MAKNFKKSMFKPIKPKECRECKELFTPYNSLQVCCSPKCATEHAKKKVWKAEKQNMIDKARTRTEWLNLAQIVFNQYINQRDFGSGKDCISCGCTLVKGQVNASHFMPVGSYPNLRFNEDNCHSSCIHCNLYLHGNQFEYSLRLPRRISEERFYSLNEIKNEPLKLTTLEIKDLIEKYKKKIKELKKYL